jgi:hypothetical protein
VGQGLSITPFLKALGFGGWSGKMRDLELLLGRLLAGAAAMRKLDNLRAQGGS